MRYHFGDYILDSKQFELSRGGEQLSLEPLIFLVLAYLVEHHKRVVSREELTEQLWPEQFVSDGSLSRCITAARKAIGDSGRTQQKIKTVQRQGYRFIATVQVKSVASIPDPAQTTSVTPNVVTLSTPQQSDSTNPHRNGRTDIFYDNGTMPRVLATLAPNERHTIGPTNPVPATTVAIDRGDMPRATAFYGRQHECERLRQWIVDTQCGLVMILGMGGMGKTALAAQIVHTLVQATTPVPFDRIIWRSLLNAPPLAGVLHDWLGALSNRPTADLPDRLDAQGSIRQFLRFP